MNSDKYLRAFRNSLYESPIKTPYCGTCHKAGLSHEEYTSHWTRKSPEPNSEIVCPLILNSLCTKCNKMGHWRKYCPDLLLFSQRTSENQFKPLTNIMYSVYPHSLPSMMNTKENDIILEEYVPPFRPSSPDYPPPDYEEEEVEPEPLHISNTQRYKTWAEIVTSKK
jgi:hypothetical protein